MDGLQLGEGGHANLQDPRPGTPSRTPLLDRPPAPLAAVGGRRPPAGRGPPGSFSLPLVCYAAILTVMGCEGNRELVREERASQRDLEVTSSAYLAAVGTLPEDHVEALTAGRKSSQPLEEEEEVKLKHLIPL